jgi:hypothetical protein
LCCCGIKKKDSGRPVRLAGILFHQIPIIQVFSRSSDFRIIPGIAAFPLGYLAGLPTMRLPTVANLQLPVPDYSGGPVTDFHRIPIC